jgi:hypothetical protein
MLKIRARQLILPAALTVTTFAVGAVIAACGGGDDDSSKKSSNVNGLALCSDLPSDACELCNDNGKRTCGPYKDCYIDPSDECHKGGSS